MHASAVHQGCPCHAIASFRRWSRSLGRSGSITLTAKPTFRLTRSCRTPTNPESACPEPGWTISSSRSASGVLAPVRVRELKGNEGYEPIAGERWRIYHLLGLASPPEKVKDDTRAGFLSEKHGRALRLANRGHESFEHALKQTREKKLSGEEACSPVRDLRKGHPTQKLHTFTVTYHTEDEFIAAFESRLRDLKGTHLETTG